MMMEIMGLHLPGASFVNPNTPMRDALTTEAARRAMAITALGNDYTPMGRMLDERVFVNGIVGLHATGGSDQSHDAYRGHGRGGRNHADLAGFLRPRRLHAAADPDLSEWERRT